MSTGVKRKSLGLTIGQFSKCLGISTNILSSWESNKKILDVSSLILIYIKWGNHS